MDKLDAIICGGKVAQVEYSLDPFDWAAQNIDYSKAQEYETELKLPYDPQFMPFLREPAASVIDRKVEECWVLKCSRAGVSENVILVPLRFIVAHRPKPVLYVSGSQKSTEDFFETRIKRGFKLCDKTHELLQRARATEHRILFEHMDLNVAWPSSTMAFKQSGYSVIFLDEVSTYKNSTIIDVIRKRTANWRWSTIVGISSPATEIERRSSEDPIFIEYESGTQKKWMMQDKNGEWFSYDLSGIKWAKDAKRTDGTWSMARVAETAHYETTSGAIITESDRMRYVRQSQAHWEANNADAFKGRESYYINAPMTPFKTGDFAHIAVKFLEAKQRGNSALRAFFYEYMPEPVADSAIMQTTEGQIYEIARSNIYERGRYPMDDAVLVLTIDTQDRYFVWSVWAMDKERHALVDHGYETDIQRFKEIKRKPYFSATRKESFIFCALIDSGGHRTHEVYRFCASNRWALAIKGDTGQNTSRYKPITIGNADGLPLRLVHPAYFKDEFMAACNGQGIVAVHFHQEIDDDYVRQVTGEIIAEEEKADKYGNRKTYWKKIRKNDFFDVAQYSFAARLLLTNQIAALSIEKTEQVDEQAKKEKAKAKRVRYG